MADRWMKRWYIQGSKDDTYTVALDINNQYGCSCPVWKFKRQECKHIKEVKIQLLEEENRELKSAMANGTVIPQSPRGLTIMKFEERIPRKFAFEDC